MSKRILCVNAGSSTLKLSFFEGEARRAAVTLPRVGGVIDAWRELTWPKPDVVVHRFVHGGERFRDPLVVTPEARRSFDALVALAPMHTLSALALLDATCSHFPDAPALVCFDTSFHTTLPETARQLAMPTRFGVRRYGFHGLSYAHVVTTLGASLGPRAVVTHLGSGASVVALSDGVPVDTTMGFSPAGGIPMATRSGDVDPGVVLHLLREHRLDADQLEHVLLHQSGLVGMSGHTEMRDLLERRATEAGARLAVRVLGSMPRATHGTRARSAPERPPSSWWRRGKIERWCAQHWRWTAPGTRAADSTTERPRKASHS